MGDVICVAILLAASFFFGLFVGADFGSYREQGKALEANAAQYDTKTGEFEYVECD